MRVVLDSNILCRDFRMSSSTFRVFLDGLVHEGHSLHIPQVVLDEVVNKYGEQLQSSKKKIDRELENVERLTRQRFNRPIADANVQAWKKEYEVEVLLSLSTKLKLSPVAAILDYPPISHRELVQRALQRRKPFKEKGSGYRDALIWESVLQSATSGTEPIAFITANIKDFADDNGRLHPDLVADITAKGEQCSEVILFKDLESFVDEHIKPTMEVLEDVRDQLAADEYPVLKLQTFIEEELPQLAGGVEWDPIDIGFPAEFESPTIVLVEKVHDIDVLDVRKLSTGELLISLSTAIECEFDFFVFKADYYTLPDYKLPFVWDSDWNRHYMAASESAYVRLMLSLTFDADSSQVTSAQITAIHPEEGDF
jgi:predicted nucleic acid-binding protein